MEVHTLSVAQLNACISDALAGAFPDELWVQGEIQGMSGSRNGHAYFRLVEPGAMGRPTDASVSVVLFRGNKRVVDHVLARAGSIELADGVEVRIRGEVVFYEPQGRVQFRMTGIDPRHTLGRLAADRDALLRQLAVEGLIERNGRLRLSPVPLRVGLVTSAGSAAAADFLHELELAQAAWEVTLLDTQVQGAGAVEHLVASLSVAARLPLDVVAVVRGGGSRTDLVAFDHEAVARTIAAMPVPVVTGIGHEVDESVADRVAHASFKTPTACAAFLCDAVTTFQRRCDQLAEALASRSLQALGRQERHVHTLAGRAAAGARTTVELSSARVEALHRSVAAAPSRSLDRADAQLASLARHVGALDPARVLARGWSITRTDDGTLVRHVADAPAGATLHTAVGDGTLTSTVLAAETAPPTTEADDG